MKKYGLCALMSCLLVLAYALGRVHEQENGIKNYQAACVLSDCCRNMVDNLGTDAEEIYYEHISNLDCDSRLIITSEDIEKYNWNY